MAATRNALLLRVLRHPDAAAVLSADDWGEILVQAQDAAVAARLGILLQEAGQWPDLPPGVRNRLIAAQRTAARFERMTRWETVCLRRALNGVATPVVLLKGAAYTLADLPIGRGRLMSDVDILVARPALDAVERAVYAHGWRPVKADPYDDRYYRDYMHELPPLVHEERGTVLDIHHTIVPPTSRLKIDGATLLETIEPIDGTHFCRLASADMVLHTAIHLFHDGEVFGGLRELLDLDGMVRDFGMQPGFWPAVLERAARPGLGRPLFYALHYCRAFLDTPVPDTVRAEIMRFAPVWPARTVMDRLVAAAFAPRSPLPEDGRGAVEQWLLYVRSHWLRMPPLLLARHLGRKAVMRLSPRRRPRGRGAGGR